MKKWKFPSVFLGMLLVTAPAFAQEFDPGYGPAPSSATLDTSSYRGQQPPQRGRGGGDVDVVLHVDLDRLLGAPQNQRGGYQQRGLVPMQMMPTWQPPQQYGTFNQQGGYYVPQAGWSGPLPQNEPPKCVNRVQGYHYCAKQFMQ